MAEVLIDSYSESNYGGISDSIGNNGAIADILASQSFTGTGNDVSRAVFFLKKSGNPTGTLTAKIYAHSGTFGTSSVLTGPVLATSDPVAHTAITTTNQLISFNFSGANRIKLTNGTRYVLVVDGTTMTAVDSSNVAQIGLDNTAPTHAGNFAFNNGSWTALSGVDLIFYIYGETGPSVTTSTPAPIGSLKATGNGTLDGTGTATVDEVGFVYGSTSVSANPGNVAPGSSGYASFVSTSGTFSIGAYTKLISGLNPKATYYVRAYAHNSNGYAYGAEIKFATNSLTSVDFLNTDPTVMFRQILDGGNVLGSDVVYDGTSTELTGTSVDYHFNTATLLDGVNVCLSLAPAGWYWYVDLGTKIAYFKNTPTTPTHTFIRGRHIASLNLVMSIEKLVNTVYFSGGDTGGGNNLFSLYKDTDSISEFGQRLSRQTDNRVTVQATADALGARTIAEGGDEAYFTKVDILDGQYDISTIRPGDTVAFSGFGNFIDGLVLQVSRLKYTPDVATLTLGTLPVRLMPSIEQVKRELIALQTVANPDSPS